MVRQGSPLAYRETEYIRLPLSRQEKEALRRRADAERRYLGQMARLIIVDHLNCWGADHVCCKGEVHDTAVRSPTDA